jgi:penicillin-binding protein 1A
LRTDSARAAREGALQGAVVAMDPFTGDVRALVGGRDYATAPYNRAVDGKRQPGSAFKLFVYTAAIEDSIAPTTAVADTALAIPLENRSIYRPGNSDGEFLGPLTLRNALARSRNPVAVQLALRLGMDTITAVAHRMGIDSPIAPFPSSAIGASVVQPLDLVAAYATVANGGARVEPRFITYIEDGSGHTVWQNPMVTPRTVLDPAAPIWAHMIASTGTSRSSVPWTPPPGVVEAELDRDTGGIADASTPPTSRYREYFLGGTEPLALRLDSWGVFRGRRSSIR